MIKKLSVLIVIFMLIGCLTDNSEASQIKIIGMGQSLSLQVIGIADQYKWLTGQDAVQIGRAHV